MNHPEVLERLSEIVEAVLKRKPYDKDVAKAIGVTPENYSNMKKRGKLPLEYITDYCAKNRVSISWVLYGQSSQMLVDNTGDILKIPFFNNVTGSAGGGSFNDDEEFTYLSLDAAYVNLLGISSNDKIDAINVTGDSMEPTLKEDSIILINRNKTEIKSGGIFAINAGGTVFIKRLSINPHGGIDMISDNKSYPVQTVSFEEAVVLGRVIGALEKM